MEGNDTVIGLSLDSSKVNAIIHRVKTATCVFDTFYQGFPGTFGEHNTLSPFNVGEVYEIDHDNRYSPSHIPIKGFRGSYPAYMFKVAELFEETPQDNSKQ